MKSILNPYLMKKIYINVFSPGDGEVFILVDVKDSYFCVQMGEFRAYYPYSSIIGIYEKNNDLLIEITHQQDFSDHVVLADAVYNF